LWQPFGGLRFAPPPYVAATHDSDVSDPTLEVPNNFINIRASALSEIATGVHDLDVSRLVSAT
jgi:hypothetical protein